MTEVPDLYLLAAAGLALTDGSSCGDELTDENKAMAKF